MQTNRPNHEMEGLVFQAMDIAEQSSRANAAEFLYLRKCPLDVIARVLAKTPEPCRPRHAKAQSPQAP